MTGLAGTAWLLNNLITGKTVKFRNESIQYQVPILISVVIMKYVILAYNRFKTKKALLKSNIYSFCLFLMVVLVIEYKG